MGKHAGLDTRVQLRYGHEMPVLGLGTWLSDVGKGKEAVEEAIRVGYRHIDTAVYYQNHDEVAEGIERAIEKGYATREDIWVTTKLWLTDFRQERVRPAVRKMLQELHLEYLDLVLIHWPCPLKPSPTGELRPVNADGHFDTDTEVDLTQTWKELEKLVDEGWIRTIGISNFTIEEAQNILDHARILPCVNQVECHPYLPQNELKEFLDSNDIAMVGYCPLANRYPENSGLNDPVVNAIAKEVGKSPAQVMLRWNIQRGVLLIPKSVTPSRIAQNADVFDFELDDGQMKRIGELGVKNIRQYNHKYRANGMPVFPE